MMNKKVLASALVFLALASLSSCHRGPADLSTAPLAGAHVGGPFSLINQDGKRVTERDFAGKFRIMYFGYTFCPDVCPTTLQHLMAGYRQFEHDQPESAAKVQPIFITIDPERDTPTVMKTYVNAFHPRLIGLTGSLAEIEAVTRIGAYSIRYSKMPADSSGRVWFDHPSFALLFGPNGEPVMILNERGTPAQIADELATWVR